MGGTPLIIVGRSGSNVGKTDLQVWEKVAMPLKEDQTCKGFREEALGLIISAVCVGEYAGKSQSFC